MVKLLATAALLATLTGTRADDKVQTVDMYRALTVPDSGKEDPTQRLQNNNLADIVGTFRYLLEEVLPEHVQNERRDRRKYSITGIAHYRMKVRNPEDFNTKDCPGFGDFGAFDYGVATDDKTINDIQQEGDFVGAAPQDPSAMLPINFSHPWYWFSVDGLCPNLPWTCVPVEGSHEDPNGNPCTKPHGVSPKGCEQGCVGKFDKSANTCKYTGEDDKDKKNKCCMVNDDGNYVKGGLCPVGKTPTGEPGCVYNYEEPTFMNMDEMVGITNMTCQNRRTGEKYKCKDWLDWRHFCYDPDKTYHKKFGEGGDIETTTYCVEFDAHPACHGKDDCMNAECMNLQPEQKDLGLPFWRGRCDADANKRRAETVATYFLKDEVKEKHVLVDPALLKNQPSCTMGSTCVPVSDGSNFCTRLFGGVCAHCKLPGTKLPHAGAVSDCPFAVGFEPGYENVDPDITCATDDPYGEKFDPLNLCCLYNLPSRECELKYGSGGKDAPLDVRGFLIAYAAAGRNFDNKEMEAFGTRYVEDKGKFVCEGYGFDKLMYNHWYYTPPKSPQDSWSNFQFALDAAMKTNSSMIKDDKSACPPPPAPPSPSGPGSKSGGVPVVAIVIIVALVIIGAGGAYAMKLRNRAREPLLGQDVQMRN
eukprot:TRINITY_DN1694_c0_g1_i1.p1 TRINITY_DN1694_c0_g1~~TRINITY_DN1694_c0_g1_i1.p1  ORF type:complete len:644 (+),score=153.02 TRINITY_DN1694_c0_g1_i1:100-2031(+)